MRIPSNPKLYHIVHYDRLQSIVEDGILWCDAETSRRGSAGTAIGMQKIKQRRRTKPLQSHPNLHVSDCVPFYFCPRSVMLYKLYRGHDPDLDYEGGQNPIVHLVADMWETIEWAEGNNRRWAFTSSNASSTYSDDFSNTGDLYRIDWRAVQAYNWKEVRSSKQAEFLVQHSFPWELISRIAVRSPEVRRQVATTIQSGAYRPLIEIRPQWYYG